LLSNNNEQFGLVTKKDFIARPYTERKPLNGYTRGPADLGPQMESLGLSVSHYFFSSSFSQMTRS